MSDNDKEQPQEPTPETEAAEGDETIITGDETEGTDPPEAGNEPDEDNQSETEPAAEELAALAAEADAVAGELAEEAGLTDEEQAALRAVVLGDGDGEGSEDGAEASPDAEPEAAAEEPAPADAKAAAKEKEAKRVERSFRVTPMRRLSDPRTVGGADYVASVISLYSPWEPGAIRTLAVTIPAAAAAEGVTLEEAQEARALVLSEWLDRLQPGSEFDLAHATGNRWLGHYQVLALVFTGEDGEQVVLGSVPEKRQQLWAYGPSAQLTVTPPAQPEPAPEEKPEGSTPEAPATPPAEGEGSPPGPALVPAAAAVPGPQAAARAARRADKKERQRLRSGASGQTSRA